MKITKRHRKAAREFLEKSAVYDVSTMRITRAGMVTAKFDPDKKPGLLNRNTRFDVAHVSFLTYEAPR